ncbi:MAG: hypothetical protein J7647_28220 [Cyanobacteria bacterium SBLK]|nr:hypothetical protein [Cyanobacteria bacterium SBLK]
MLQKFITLCKLPESIVKELAFFPYQSGIILNSTDAFVARWLARNSHAIEEAMKELGIYHVTITVRGKTYWPISIDKDPILGIKNEVATMPINVKDLIDIDLDSLDLSHPDFILTELNRLKYPAFITFLNSEETCFYNIADALRMPDAPPSKFVTFSQELIYPNELENRNRLLRMDGQLKDYAYKGMRLYKDEGLWRKREMSFVSDFSLCEFRNCSARIGITKHEEELSKFVD